MNTFFLAIYILSTAVLLVDFLHFLKEEYGSIGYALKNITADIPSILMFTGLVFVPVVNTVAAGIVIAGHIISWRADTP